MVRDVDRRNRFVADAAVLFESIMQYAREQNVMIDRLTPTISSNPTARGAQQIAQVSLAIEGNHDPDNWIDPRQLGHLEATVLRECFKETGDLHDQIKRIFG